MTVGLMHTKFSVRHYVLLSSFTLVWLASACLAVFVYLTCLSAKPQVVHRICFASSGCALDLSEALQLNFPFYSMSHITGFLYIDSSIKRAESISDSQKSCNVNSMLIFSRYTRKQKGKFRFIIIYRSREKIWYGQICPIEMSPKNNNINPYWLWFKSQWVTIDRRDPQNY